MEGKRVHSEIKEEYRKAAQTGSDDLDDALGKTIPRESDKQLLEEYEAKRQNARQN